MILRGTYPGTMTARMRILHYMRHDTPKEIILGEKLVQESPSGVDEGSTATSHQGTPLSGTLRTITRHPTKRLLLFYRYMLPSFTSETYSWADPENANSGFKTGVENCFRSSMMVCSRSFSRPPPAMDPALVLSVVSSFEVFLIDTC